MGTLKVAAVILAALGTIIVVAAVGGPLIQTYGYVHEIGPAPSVQFNSSVTYWTDTFGIPPMEPGQQLTWPPAGRGPGTSPSKS